jgi:hypothetical protein
LLYGGEGSPWLQLARTDAPFSATPSVLTKGSAGSGIM